MDNIQNIRDTFSHIIVKAGETRALPMPCHCNNRKVVNTAIPICGVHNTSGAQITCVHVNRFIIIIWQKFAGQT